MPVQTSYEDGDQAVLVRLQAAPADVHRGPAIAGTAECELQQW